MCIAFLAISENPQEDGYKVIIAMNRDEYFNRPTKPAQLYKGTPDIIAGIDMCNGPDGATWLGISTTGRIGILTNYRQSDKFIKPGAKCRAELVTNFLKSNDSPDNYLTKLTKQVYKGFNLIVGNILSGDVPAAMDFGYYCNEENKQQEKLKPGVHAISNRYLNYGWMKINLGKKRFEEIIQQKCTVITKTNMLLEMLQNKTVYPDDELFLGPQDDGIPRSFLESFTAIFVLNAQHPPCGTRTNTVIIVDNEDNATFVERTMVEPIDLNNIQWKTNVFDFKIAE